MGDSLSWAEGSDDSSLSRKIAEENRRKNSYNGLATREDRDRYIQDNREALINQYPNPLPMPGTLCIVLADTNQAPIGGSLPPIVLHSPVALRNECTVSTNGEPNYRVINPIDSEEIRRTRRVVPSLSVVMFLDYFLQIDAKWSHLMVLVLYDNSTYVVPVKYLYKVPEHLRETLLLAASPSLSLPEKSST